MLTSICLFFLHIKGTHLFSVLLVSSLYYHSQLSAESSEEKVSQMSVETSTVEEQELDFNIKISAGRIKEKSQVRKSDGKLQQLLKRSSELMEEQMVAAAAWTQKCSGTFSLRKSLLLILADQCLATRRDTLFKRCSYQRLFSGAFFLPRQGPTIKIYWKKKKKTTTQNSLLWMKKTAFWCKFFDNLRIYRFTHWTAPFYKQHQV